MTLSFRLHRQSDKATGLPGFVICNQDFLSMFGRREQLKLMIGLACKLVARRIDHRNL